MTKEDKQNLMSDEEHEDIEETEVSQEEQTETVVEEAQQLEVDTRYDELMQRYLRLQADYDNYRKRTQKEKEDMAKYAASSLLQKLLPVIDNFERALESSKQTNNVETLAQGIDMVYRQMMDALKEEGLVPIESVGKPFDPYYHQAVMQEENDAYESGVVCGEFQKGYQLKDKVIRPAMVKVTS